MSSKSCVKLLLILFIGSLFTQIWAQQRSISLSPQPAMFGCYPVATKDSTFTTM